MSVSLKKFEKKDAVFIRDNFPTYFKDNSIENIESSIDKWKHTLGFCIMYDNQKVGIIALGEKQEGVLCWGTAILEEFRGKGIATKAFELILVEAKKQGYSKIISSCAKSNIASRKLHQKVGFRLIKEEINPAGNEMCRWERNI